MSTSRPVAFYAWSGLEQHSNATQTVRAINELYALTGSFDARGGNVLFPSVPTNSIDGAELLAADQRVKAIGVDQALWDPRGSSSSPARTCSPQRWKVAPTTCAGW